MNAIDVSNVTKIYKLYDKPVDRLKEAFSLTKKKRYTPFYALNHVSFQVEKGQSVGIIGTNGSGKSTILKIITGVLSPSEGDVVIDGRISALLELGAGFNPDYTGIENIYMNGTMMGYRRDEMDAKMEEILGFADIGDFVYQPVKTYSSGMFVRLAFALAINVEPEILIVDEALSVGDVFFQSKCYKKINEIKERGTTILLVTHDMSSVIKYCDKVVLLNRGNKVAEGTPGDMVDIYKKILANQYNENEEPEESGQSDERALQKETVQLWKEKLGINASFQEYGDKRVEILDFGIFDAKDNITNIVSKNEHFTIRMRVRLNAEIESPIFAFTIKDKKGTELTGTNTFIEEIDTDKMEKGKEYIISFRQKASLQGGEYLLSLGCTGYEGDELSVFDRLYDITYLTILSDKNTVGYYDMYSDVEVLDSRIYGGDLH